MSALWGQVAGAVTVLSMLSFIGIWIWVWNRRHQAKYDALSRMPMADAEDPS